MLATDILELSVTAGEVRHFLDCQGAGAATTLGLSPRETPTLSLVFLNDQAPARVDIYQVGQ